MALQWLYLSRVACVYQYKIAMDSLPSDLLAKISVSASHASSKVVQAAVRTFAISTHGATAESVARKRGYVDVAAGK